MDAKYIYVLLIDLSRIIQISEPLFALIFFTYLPESQIQKKFLFIQTNSFIIFTCPNPVLLVLAQTKWISTKSAEPSGNVMNFPKSMKIEIYELKIFHSIIIFTNCPIYGFQFSHLKATKIGINELRIKVVSHRHDTHK